MNGRKFALGAILPQNKRSVIQCTSTAVPGVTISFLSVIFFTGTMAVTGEGGTITRQTSIEFTNIPTSTVVQSSAVTVYAPPVNGFNIVQRQVSNTSTGAGSTTATPPQTSPLGTSDVMTRSSGLSPGTIAGAVVGAVFGLGLLALVAFFWRRGRRQHSAVGRPELAAGGGSGQGVAVSEMFVKHQAHELPHGEYAHELPGQNQVVEMLGRES